MIVYRELSSIEADLGISAKTLYSISNNIGKHYKRTAIPKKDGSFRHLTIPDEILKKIQRRINENILIYQPISAYATAYRPNACLALNAAPHLGKKQILKIDIKHFFDSISYSQVKEMVFPESVFSEKIRVLLSLLCYFQNSLPQGAPSSPAITNIIMRSFDENVGDWCGEQNITYTRYCDDMTFSGEFDKNKVIDFVALELKKYGFFINKSKTKFISGAQRQTVTGVVVNKKINAQSSYRKKIRQELFYIKKLGAEAHMANLGVSEPPQKYLLRLLGRINFVLSLTPENTEMQTYRSWLSEQIKNYNQT